MLVQIKAKLNPIELELEQGLSVAKSGPHLTLSDIRFSDDDYIVWTSSCLVNIGILEEVLI